MKFSDLLNSTLPSQVKPEDETVQESVLTEGADCGSCDEGGCDTSTEEDGIDDSEVGEVNSDVDADDVDDISNSDEDDDFDPDDLSDDELMALDKELSDDAIDSVIDDEDDNVSLDPEEEIKADNMMSMAATTLLLNDELNAQEKADFVNNDGAVNAAINEGFMTDADVVMLAESSGLVTEGKYNKKMIIRLDAESKKKQLYALAVNVSAAANHDPDYVKLKKVMKMRKILRAKLERKYHAEATKRMKIYFKRLSRSNAPALAKVGKKYSK